MNYGHQLIYRKIEVNGQLTHHGHELDPAHLRVPQKVRDEVVDLLRDWHRPEDIPGIIRQSNLK